MSKPILILGDGVVAKLINLALSEAGIAAMRLVQAQHVVDKNKVDPRSYALTPSSYRLLQHLGLNDVVRTEVPKIEIFAGENMRGPSILLEEKEPLIYMADHSEIFSALDALIEPAIVSKNALEVEGGHAIFDKNKFDLVLIAEGKYSQNLSRYGFSKRIYDYDTNAIVAKFDTQYGARQIARQVFMKTGPLGVLPDVDKAVSIVWSQEKIYAERLMLMNEEEFTNTVREIIGDIYGELRLLTTRSTFPIFSMSVDKLSEAPFLLLGDAAHALHPMAGQGLNLGIRDVAVLVDLIVAQKRLGLPITAKALSEEYKKRRSGDISRLEMITRSLDMITRGSRNVVFKTALKLGANIPQIEKICADFGDPPLSPQPYLMR